MAVRLNEAAITAAGKKALETKARVEIADAGCPGLRLRVTVSGAKSWVLACRDRLGAMRRFGVGKFPAMGVSDARDEARAIRARVADGADPTADRRRDRAMGASAKEGIGTLEAVLDIYEAKVGQRLKSWDNGRKRLELVFKPLLTKPVKTLAAIDFQMQADAYVFPSSASFAVRSVRPVLKWAAQRGYLGPEIAAAIHQPEPTRQRERVLTTEELKALLPVLADSERPYAAAMRLMLLTLARRDEVTSAIWRNIDLEAKIWTIPVSHSKNARLHRIPLSKQAIGIITSLDKGKATERVFQTSKGGPLINWDRETKVIQKASGTTGWTRHDLRRTGATLLGDLGFNPHVIEAALNHVSIHSPLAATYNRSRYLSQVTKALQTLADRFDVIAVGGAGAAPSRIPHNRAARNRQQ